MQLRLFFPLFAMIQIISDVSTAHKQEINKLRQFGIKHISPYFHGKTLKKYPYKITITFYCSADADMVSMLIHSAYILKMIGWNSLQSVDYRVIPQFDIRTKKVQDREHEGCEILIEKITD